MFKCKICNEEFDKIIKFTNHLRYKHGMKVKDYYDKYIKEQNEEFCLTCGKVLTFKSLKKGYGQFCSTKCISKSEVIKQKKKNSYKEKYGVDNPSKNQQIKEKKKQTALKNFGVEYSFQSDKIREKSKETCLNKYGVEYIGQSQEVKNKSKETCLNKYGVEYSLEHPEIREKIKNTNLERYGSSCVLKNNEIQEKIKETNLTRYNTDFPIKTPEVREKIKNTNLEKYGVEYSLQSPEVQEKIKETNLNKYGTYCVLQNPEIQKKIKNTNLNKYGVEYIGQSQYVKDKIKNTNLEKYGVEYSTQNNKIKKKIKETTFKNFGVYYPTQSKEIIEKIKETNLNKYGTYCVLQNPEVREKIKNTNLNKYGVEYIGQNQEVKNKIRETRFKNFIPKLFKLLDYFNLELIEEYEGAHKKHKFKCKKCGTEFIRIWNDIQQGLFNCPNCGKKFTSTSKSEKDISDFIKSLGIEIIENSKQIIPPKELDIYLPNYNLAIEFNGLYWHSDKFLSDNFYHLNKTNKCNEKGIRLIHIFEDEWVFNKDIVKERLKSILGFNDKQKIYARNCLIKEIDPKTKNEFLDQFHLQGKDSSNIKLGAFYNNELVSVMTFSKGNISKGTKPKDGVWELNRFCSNYNYHIPGIASKLLMYFKRNYKWIEIFSYADKRWSDGNLYYKLGFKHVHDSDPNYWYTNGSFRIHRFNLRKKENEPKDIPEWALRESEGYFRLWDCGNKKFKTIKKD